jgi:hypothetical protein
MGNMESAENKEKKLGYVVFALIAMFGFVLLLGGYVRLWEAKQPRLDFPEARVQSIEPYRLTNDLHWSLKGYRVRIVGENRPIDFSAENWEKAVNVGDTVNVTVRRSFTWFGLKDELDGLSIDEHR